MHNRIRIRKIVAAILALLVCAMLLRDLRPEKVQSDFAVDAFSRTPVLETGRIKPLDTVARTSLMLISGKQSWRDSEDLRHPASEWVMKLLLLPQEASNDLVFRIDHPDVVGMLGEQNEKRKYFSLHEISQHFATLQQEFAQIPAEPKHHDSYHKALAKLQDAISVYDRLAYSLIPPPFFGSANDSYAIMQRAFRDHRNAEPGSETHSTVENALQLFQMQYSRLAETAYFQAIPPGGPNQFDEWHNLGQSLMASIDSGVMDPVVLAYAQLSSAYTTGDLSAFDAQLANIQNLIEQRSGDRLDKVSFESFFNDFAPFYSALEIYFLVILIAAVSWLIRGRFFATAALWILSVAFIVHTFGMAARIYIQERPPVTNLYSSAIFVGWGAVLLCLFLEKRYRNGIASAAAGVVGFCTLIIAHHLSLSGDTMEVMRAVLDSNFWLATHVPVVTVGYSATFLAGILALIYIIRDRLFGGLDAKTSRSIEAMVYGIVCFALLFSYVGTVLGGIWADQSWGRFWGWDPKENGALMIVLWNAVILHARWAKIAGPIGLMQMALVGNIITAWSWFGTNMLGVGLHSYGFTDAAFLWLLAFVISQVVVILIGCLPGKQRQITT